jgi:hypothetical protein
MPEHSFDEELPEKQRAAVVPCRCQAYPHPHRPGAGLCRWPDPPKYRTTTPQGTRRGIGRMRVPGCYTRRGIHSARKLFKTMMKIA